MTTQIREVQIHDYILPGRDGRTSQGRYVVYIDGKAQITFHRTEEGREAMIGWMAQRLTFAEAACATWIAVES